MTQRHVLPRTSSFGGASVLDELRDFAASDELALSATGEVSRMAVAAVERAAEVAGLPLRTPKRAAGAHKNGASAASVAGEIRVAAGRVPIVDIKTASLLTGYTVRWLRQEIASGRLPAVGHRKRDGRLRACRIRLRVTAIARWLDEREDS